MPVGFPIDIQPLEIPLEEVSLIVTNARLARSPPG